MAKWDGTRWLSDDGRFVWNGSAWRQVESGPPAGPPAGFPNPPAAANSGSRPWLKGLIAVVGVFAAIWLFTHVGNVIAVAGVVLAVVAFFSPAVRGWAVWRSVALLRRSTAPAAFAVILAAYLVPAPAERPLYS